MKFGVIGTNFISKQFMEGAMKVEGIEVVAVCSGRYENAEAFAREYAIPKVCKNYEEMAEDMIVDAVYVAVPNSLHYEITKYFLEHKIPVFLEKPMCSNAKEAKALVELAREKNTYLHHGIIPLYNPNLKVLKEKLPLIGRVHNAMFIFSQYSSRFDAYLRNENPTTFRRELSNGSIMDLGVYPLSIVLALFGRPTSITAHANLLETEVDASFQAILSYDGFSVLVASSKASDTKLVSEISGEKGILQITRCGKLDEVIFTPRKMESMHFVYDKQAFMIQLEDFKNAVEEKRVEPTVSHELNITLMEVLDEIRSQCGVVYPADRREV